MTKYPIRRFARRGLRTGAVAALLGLSAGALLAQEPLVTDRPDFTESASAVEPGRVQVEAGVTREEVDGGSVTTIGEILARIGVVPGIEARVGAPSWIESSAASGIGNAFLGAKAEVPAGGGWDGAILFGATVPVGDEDVASDAWEPEVVVAASHELGPRAELGLNAGWGRPLEDEERVDEFVASGAVGFDLGDGWGAFAEAFGFATVDDAGPAHLNAGVTRRMGPDLQLDARIGAGLFQAAGEWFVGIGFSRRW